MQSQKQQLKVFTILKKYFLYAKKDINLLSQEQIYLKNFYQVSIIDDKICIDSKGMFARFIKNTLYIIDIAGSSNLNKKTRIFNLL